MTDPEKQGSRKDALRKKVSWSLSKGSPFGSIFLQKKQEKTEQLHETYMNNQANVWEGHTNPIQQYQRSGMPWRRRMRFFSHDLVMVAFPTVLVRPWHVKTSEGKG